MLKVRSLLTMKTFSSSSQGFKGPVQRHIEKKIYEKFNPVVLQVTNESHGRKEDESHFHVVVVSEAFNSCKLLLQRHRMVQNLFKDENGSLKFHSLRITAKTPEQWEESKEIAKAPKCTGKGDGRRQTDASLLD